MKNTLAVKLTLPAHRIAGAHAADAIVGHLALRAPALLGVNAGAAPGPEA